MPRKLNRISDFLALPAVKTGRQRRRELVQLGQYLRSIRERRGLTQAQLAQQAGISQPEVCRLESGAQENGPLMESVRRYVIACKARLRIVWEDAEDETALEFVESSRLVGPKLVEGPRKVRPRMRVVGGN